VIGIVLNPELLGQAQVTIDLFDGKIANYLKNEDITINVGRLRQQRVVSRVCNPQVRLQTTSELLMDSRTVASGRSYPLPSENRAPPDRVADAAIPYLDARWTKLVHVWSIG